jgi:hypothetical protein
VNPFEFVLILMGLIFAFQIVKHKMGIPNGRRRDRDAVPFHENSENRMLRDEVRQLKERLAVLERITVEKENSLSREIEDLRNK